MHVNKTAVILCGGMNIKRENVHKAFLIVDNERFIDRIIKSFKDFEEVIIVCKDKTLFYDYKDKVKIIEDEIKDIGPIAGLYTALKNSKSEEVMVVSCDMPLIDEYIINRICSIEFNEEALIPFVYGKSQYLCGIYKRDIIYKIKELIKNKEYAIKKLFNNISVRYIFPKNENNFININTFGDYVYLRRKSESLS